MKRTSLSEIVKYETNPYYDKCPNCGYDFGIYKSYEIRDNQILLFMCGSCDWYDFYRDLFFVGGWSIRIYRALAPIDILQSLLADQEVVDFLRPKLKEGGSYLADPPSPFRQWSNDYLWGEVSFASESYWGQMVVLAAAYVELILKDFLRCYFISGPQRMDEYLPRVADEKNARISLKQILQAESKEKLIEDLAMIAIGNARPSRFDVILKRLIEGAKIELDRPLIDNLLFLREQRNQFAHQATGKKISAEQVYNWFDDIRYLLYVLAGLSVRYEVPYYDDVDFLAKFTQSPTNAI